MLLAFALAVAAPKLELGVVMNIDLRTEAGFRRHFEIADGWASFIRVSIGMDQEGWRPELERLPFKRNRRLAVEARERGWGMDIHLGGVPHPDEWMKLGSPVGAYSRKNYREMPRAWWPKWAEYQRVAAKAIVDAYGPEAKSKIRFQLFNEPYDRGENAIADELMAYLIPRIIDRDGTVFGCALDGPSLWGPPAQMNKQFGVFAAFLSKHPKLAKHIQKVPVSMYPSPDLVGQRDPDELVRQYITEAKRTVSEGEFVTGKPIYFSEAGVGRSYDIRPSVYGGRTNEIAEKALIRALDGFRNAGFQHVTIYQTKDDTEADAQGYAYGLADRFGRLRVDLSNLFRLKRGEPIETDGSIMGQSRS